MSVEEISSWDERAAAHVGRVREASADHDGHDPLDEQAALLLKNHGLAGSRLWTTEHGFALLHGTAIELAVAPEGRGRGEGTALAAAAADTSTGATTAWSHGDHPAARALATTHGFAATRELWVMRRPLTDLPPVRTDVEIRGYRDTDRDEVLRVNAAAFAHHPEQGSMDAAGLAERMAEPWFDPAGLLVAPEGDHLLGFHWTKRHDADLGEVYVVAIAPEAQGRGLGPALTLAGLHHLADTGASEVLLYVESDNHPARTVYERLGFTHAAADTHVQFTRS